MRDLLTSAEIANGLGKDRNQVRRQLADCPSEPIVVRGQATRGYRLESLPVEIRATLDALASRGGYRSVSDLCRDAKARWEPGIPKSEIDPEQMREAAIACELLAPILESRGGESVRQMVARAMDSGRRKGVSVGSASTIRRTIERALARDHGREEWTRVEIYLPEAIRRQTGPRTSGAVTAASLYLAEFSDGHSLTALQRTSLFEVALRDVKALAPLLGEKRARRQVVDSIMASGVVVSASRKALVKMMGEYFARIEQGGGPAVADNGKKRGRKAAFSLTDEEVRALRALTLKRDSMALAIEEFADDPACRPETRQMICARLDDAARKRRAPQWPPSLLRAARVSKEEAAMFRGRKAMNAVEFMDRRDMTIVLPDCSRVPLGPNDLRESDDMSLNEPFSYVDPETREIRVGRQSLCTIDVFSAHWLGATPIGRERDAYRAEDIADHIAAVIDAHGLPLVWRFERGPWECDFIDGVMLPAAFGEHAGTRWGGLDGLFHVQHAFKSKGKGLIESSFRLLQSLMAHESASIGRRRGEFERQTKLFLKAGRGNEVAASAFWDIKQAADGMEAAMQRFNRRPKVRRAFGRDAVVPVDLFQRVPIRPVPADQAWRLLPVKKPCTVRGGHIETTVNHYPLPFRFRVNGESDLYLEQGYRLLVAFHPGRPDEGAWIFNGETGTRNRDGLKFGEFLCVAPLATDAPQVTLSRDIRGFEPRRKANAAVRSEFRAILPSRQAGNSRSTARNSWGDRSEVIHGVMLDAERERVRPLSTTKADVRRRNGDAAIEAARRARDAREVTAEDLADLERKERELFPEIAFK